MTYKAVFDQKRRFGIEIELSKADRYELLHAFAESGLKAKIALFEDPDTDCWILTEDGSIRGEDPVELKSPILVGTNGLLEVRKVLTLLDYLDYQTNSSCGFHVHQHIEDFAGKDVLALLRLYSKFESVIDGLVDISRREDKNIHCRSLVKDDTLAWITELNKTGTSRAIETILRFNNLYKSRQYKVNVASYLKYATVEFRHFQATTNADEAVNWIALTQLIIGKAKHASVSKEMSAKPVLGEMLRVLGMVEFQESRDPYVVQCREWVKGKYATIRGRKSGSHAGRIESSQRRESSLDSLVKRN